MDEELLGRIVARFAPRLRELRDKAGLTQMQLSQRSGVRQASISEYEKGVSSPNWPAVVRLALTLGVSVDAFAASTAK